MKKAYIFLLLALFHLVSPAQNVVLLEYFVDTDAGYGNNTVVNVTPAADGTFPFNVDLTNTSVGSHKLYVRTRDSDGKWSLTSRRNIEVFPFLTDKNITAAEYFFDTDPGVGHGTSFSVSPQTPDITQNFIANTSSLAPGYHKLYIRVKDAQGQWSITSRRNVEMPFPESISVAAGEYFFDIDPGFGNASPITISSQDIQVSQDFVAVTATLIPGYHKLYLRTRNEQGKWGITSRRNVEVIVNNGPLYVSGVEYFFGDDPGVGKASFITFGIPLTDGSFNFTIPANEIPAGPDTLFLRVKDSMNMNWSLTTTKVKYYITGSCPRSIWLGAVSNDWHNSANWSCNQVPDAMTEVVIVSLTTFPCEVLTGSTAVCQKITAVPGSTVKVNNGATLNVYGN